MIRTVVCGLAVAVACVSPSLRADEAEERALTWFRDRGAQVQAHVLAPGKRGVEVVLVTGVHGARSYAGPRVRRRPEALGGYAVGGTGRGSLGLRP